LREKSVNRGEVSILSDESKLDDPAANPEFNKTLSIEGFVQHRQRHKLVPVRPSEPIQSNLANSIQPDLREDVKEKEELAAQTSKD